MLKQMLHAVRAAATSVCVVEVVVAIGGVVRSNSEVVLSSCSLSGGLCGGLLSFLTDGAAGKGMSVSGRSLTSLRRLVCGRIGSSSCRRGVDGCLLLFRGVRRTMDRRRLGCGNVGTGRVHRF